MADPQAAPEVDPFDQFDSSRDGQKGDGDPFARFDSSQDIAPPAPQTTAAGAFARGVVRGTLPAGGGLAGAGAGAEVGSIFGPWGTLAGLVAGSFVGAEGVAKAQDWALSQLPDSWRDTLGFSDRQEKLDQGEHPIASFLGGLAPYAITMRPGAVPTTALPENATALQRLVGHPITKRLFGGAAIGGMELGQEAAQDDKISWPKVAISTAFGLVLNRPTAIGERITELGARPTRTGVAKARDRARTLLGRPQPTPAAVPGATLAQAADSKVMGPGVTEPVFQGSEAQDATAEQAARETAAIETPPIPPDLRALARQMRPELFANFDELSDRERALSQWLAEVGPDEAPAAATHLAQTRAAIEALKPEVRAAHRSAAEAVGAEMVGPAARFASMAEMLAARGEQTAPAPENIPTGRTIEEQKASIGNDVTRSLLAAGRPQEEAELSGRVWAERYAALSEELNGAISPEDLYRYEAGAEIRGPGGRPPAAGGTAPPIAPGPQPPLSDIDNTHDVVSGANSVVGGPVVIDRRIPEYSPTLKDNEGRPVNLHNLLHLHERVEEDEEERLAMEFTAQHGRAPSKKERDEILYPAAHEAATAAEREVAERTGIDFGAYTKEIDGYLSTIENEKPENPPTGEMHVDPEKAIGHHRAQNKRKVEAYAPLVAQWEKIGMIENAEKYRAAAMRRRERYGATGGGQVFTSAAAQARAMGLTDRAAVAEREALVASEGKRFDDGLKEAELMPADVPADVRETAVQAMVNRGMEPIEAYEYAMIKAEHEAQQIENEDARYAAEGIIETEEPHAHVPEIPFDTGADLGRVGEAHEAARTQAPPATGVEPPQARGLRREEELEYYQRRRIPRDLIAEREAQGQTQLPGMDRITQAEMVQRQANQPLRPGVEQKPMDVGLFSDMAKQKELFQGPQGRVRIRPGQRPIITLARTADFSAFMHESGHVFLEELMRFGDHPQASEQLKADKATTRRWLGAENPDAITRRQHEKFARGFEQYLREGIAPSPQLASVFARFRDWLLKIYQTLRGLGAPINEDIRGVFDRMLAARPQRTVIAPERMERPGLADIHEDDARSTEPPEAHAAMDRVVAEASQFHDNLPGGIHAEFAADEQRRAERGEPAAAARPEDRTGAAGGEPLPSALAERQPVASGALGGAQPVPELQRGGKARPAGESLRGGGERPGQPSHADALLGDKPLAPRPAESLSEPDKLNIGKDGNIRAENITSVADFVRAIDESSERIAAERGSSDVLTMGEMTDLASDLAIDPASISQQELAGIFGGVKNIAAKIWALRKAVRDHAQSVHEASIRARDSQSDEDYAAAVQAFLRQDMLQSVLSSVTTEMGRGLGMAFRNMEGWQKAADLNQHVKDATGLTLFQWKSRIALAAELKTPQQIAQYTRDMNKKNFGRLVLEYWINGLISGPVTHITYMIGNELLALEKAGPETAMAAAVGAVRKALGREGETVRLGEVAEQLRTHFGAVPVGLKAAVEALRTGVTTELPGERAAQNVLQLPGTEYATPAMLDEAARYGDVMQSLYALGRGIKDGLIAGGELTKAQAPAASWRYSPTGYIPDLQLRGIGTVPVGTAIRLPSRLIAAVHSFFRAINYSMEKNRLAYRTAAEEGLTGTKFEERLGELRQRPTDAMMQQAASEATELTLMGQGGVFTQRLSGLMNTPFFAQRDARGKIVPGTGVPLLKFVDPFVHISSNIIDQAIIQRTPLGILSPEIRADLMGRNGNIAQDTATARMLMGTIYALGFGYLAAQGYVTGSEPSDPRQAAIWRLTHQAHSVRIGDMWYDMHRLGPLGMLMGTAADLYDVAHDLSEEDIVTAASHLQHAITQNILDESFMRGPADLIQAIEDPARYGQSYIRSQLATAVPYSVGLAQIARMADPYSRQARTVMDTLRRGIPGLSQQLMPRRDVWGEEIPRGGLGTLTAIYEQRVNSDPVNQALLQLGVYPATLERKIRNVPLTDQQYDDFQRIAGRMTKMRLDAIVNSPDFHYWPNHLRRNVIEEVVKQSREAARGIMFMKYPQIVRDATQTRIDRLTKD